MCFCIFFGLTHAKVVNIFGYPSFPASNFMPSLTGIRVDDDFENRRTFVFLEFLSKFADSFAALVTKSGILIFTKTDT